MGRPSARHLTVLLALACLLALAAPAQAADYRGCGSISNPYAGSRYEGSDIRRVRALRVSCRTARRVAKRAHARALGMTPNSSGYLYLRYRRWNVTGNLRGDNDRYVGKARGGKRVRWVF